jgi:2-oxoglutarate ferredoxin oxidoreductase subunit alpha
MKKAKKIILIEANVTGQLGRLLREKTGLKVDKKILKYDGRPFTSTELKQQIKKLI